MLKKILFFVAFLSFVISASANRDSVTNRKYMWNVSFPYNMEVTIKNTSCAWNENVFNWDVSSILNVTWLDWSTCSISWNKVSCTKTISWWPIWAITWKFKIYASKKEILEKIWVPQKIYDNITWNYVQEFTIKMNIITDSNWGNSVSRATNFDFSDLADKYLLFGWDWVYEYSDESECNTCIQEMTWTWATWDSCSWTWDNRVCETNICSDPDFPIDDEPDDICTTSPCLTDGKIAPVLSYIKFDTCTVSWLDSICYAKADNNLKIKLSTLGQWYDPVWIKYLRFVANNYSNTSSVWNITNSLVNISTVSEKLKTISYSTFKDSWKYTIEFQWRWILNDSWTWSNIIDKKLIIIPNNNLKLWTYTIDKTSVYASNSSSESIRYCKEIFDEFWNEINTIYNVDSNVTILDWVKDADNNESLLISNIKFENSKFCFDINSLVPVTKTLKFKIKVPKHKQLESLVSNGLYKEFIIQTPTLEFKQPFSVELNWTENPQIWKDQNYKIKLINNWNISFTNWTLDLTSSSINLLDWHYWTSFNVIKKSWLSDSDNIAKFSWVIDANNNVLVSPKLNTKNLYFKYTIWWKTVRYKLDDSNILEWVAWCNIETLWAKIIWNLQWQWKQIITWQQDNISDLSKSDLRNKIRKEAYKAIWIRNSSKTNNINWIIYVDWDVKYSEIKNYINIWETIIVKDWNFIIDEDINKFIWIIVLKDNYKILSDYDNAWNVYVNNNVQNIDAIIYADWAFRSARFDWSSYDDSDLNRQLKLNWSLFTRNTIGWAVLWNSNFTLPWWEVTTDYNLASIYDLNYIRKVSPECDASWNQIENSISFIIKYNPSVQINPPKIFGN